MVSSVNPPAVELKLTTDPAEGPLPPPATAVRDVRHGSRAGMPSDRVHASVPAVGIWPSKSPLSARARPR